MMAESAASLSTVGRDDSEVAPVTAPCDTAIRLQMLDQHVI
jgi:hypothetical protein